MKRLSTLLAGFIFCLMALVSSAFATSYVNSYSTISYDSGSDTVTVHTFTSLSYSASVYYQPYIDGFIYNGNGDDIGDGTGTITDNEADLDLSVPGNGCDWYELEGRHFVTPYYYVYGFLQDGAYLDGYYDYDNYHFYEGEVYPDNVYIGSHQFTSVGPIRVAESDLIFLGSTEQWGNGTCNSPPQSVTITKADGSGLSYPLRLGKTGTLVGGGAAIDRTQHLSAKVSPPILASYVTIDAGSKVTLSNVSIDNTRGIVSFDVVGNTRSTDKGDSYIKAKYLGDDLPDTNKPVSVVVPSKIATPHDHTGTYVGATNMVLDGDSVPAIWGLNSNDVYLATAYCRNLTITVTDQFDALIGDVYLNAVITETDPGHPNQKINQSLTSSSTYTDAICALSPRSGTHIVTRGSSAASSWPTDPHEPMTYNIYVSDPGVQVDGFGDLDPGLEGRVVTDSPPNSIFISW